MEENIRKINQHLAALHPGTLIDVATIRDILTALRDCCVALDRPVHKVQGSS